MKLMCRWVWRIGDIQLKHFHSSFRRWRKLKSYICNNLVKDKKNFSSCQWISFLFFSLFLCFFVLFRVRYHFNYKPFVIVSSSVLMKSKGEVSFLKVVTWQGVEEVSGGHFVFQQVVGGKLTTMDSKGNKVLVCDNGTGVSQSFG